MIIAIIIISILILAISLTKFYKWNFPLVIISFVLFLIIRNLLSYYFALATLFYYIFSCLTWALINNMKPDFRIYPKNKVLQINQMRHW